MSIIFQNPIWLLAALALVPLLAHLFSRTRPRRREFPSLRLLKEAMRHITRVRKPRDRWLLALRTLAMIALLLAFLQPWLQSRQGDRSGAARTVVLVVDVSASMGYADGTRTRLAQATAAAEEVLGSLPPDSRANVVWVRASASSALPEPGPNLEFLRQSLRQASVLAEAGDIGGALALASRQLSAADGEREMLVFSDFQKSAWREATWEAPPGVRLTRVAVGEEEGGNVGLSGLAVEPARPIAGQDARLVCRVRNFSGSPRRMTVFAEAGEGRLSQAVEAAPWSETLALIPLKFPQEGLIPIKASLSEDRFTGDDVRYGLAEVRGAVQVAVAGAAEDATARVWERAARALGSVTTERFGDAASAAAKACDVIFVAGWDGQAQDVLLGHLKRGGALVLQLREGVDLAPAVAPLGVAIAGEGAAPLAPEARDLPGWGIRIASEEHPIFSLFANGAFGDPADARFRRRVVVDAIPGAQMLLVFEDGKPALQLLEVNVGAAKASPVALWSMDLAASEWPSRTPFISFFGEMLRHLSLRSGTQSLREFRPGDALAFDTGAAIDPADVRLLDERDQRVKAAAESARSPGRLIAGSPAVPGSFRWTAQDAVLDRAVVNFPDTESDLRRLSPAELQGGPGAVVANAGRSSMANLREGKPLWPWCLAAAAAFLLAEAVCLWLLSRSGPPAGGGSAAPHRAAQEAAVR